MNTVGVKDFTMLDLIKPESKRLRRHISAVINFAKFREERLVHGVELTQEVDALAAKKQQAEDENERLVNELRAATAVREQEAPEEARLKAENEGLATTVQEAFNQQTAVHEDSLRLKQELEQVKDRLAETKYQVLNAKEELEQLRAQIVPDPKRLKQELAALQEAVAHEKENVRQVEASGVEVLRQLEAAKRAEREMEAVLHKTAPTTATPCSSNDLPSSKIAASIDQEGDLRLRSWPKPIRLKRRSMVLLLVACTSGLLVGVMIGTNMVQAVPPPLPARRPTNVVLMVADGYGPASATLARVIRARVYNPVVPKAEGDGVQPLELDAFMTGQIHTRSADHLITDSAAGASALSCGRKTNNTYVAVDVLERPCATLMEAAKAANMVTGLAVTSSVTGATPAAFAAHARRRSLERSIALQLASSGPDVLLGGGELPSNPSSSPLPLPLPLPLLLTLHLTPTPTKGGTSSRSSSCSRRCGGSAATPTCTSGRGCRRPQARRCSACSRGAISRTRCEMRAACVPVPGAGECAHARTPPP